MFVKLPFPHQKQHSKRKIGVTLKQDALTNQTTQKIRHKRMQELDNKKTKTQPMNMR